MPPKPKETQIFRPALSESSLILVPEDAIEGYQDRIETGVDWTLSELGIRHHKSLCMEDVPTVPFSEALQRKIKQSVLSGLFNESNIDLKGQWELIIPIAYWEDEKFSNEEGNILFQNNNCITDDLPKLIKKAVICDNIEVLKNELKMVSVLRLGDTEMTELDEELLEFKKLVYLNVCGNFIENLDASCIPESLRNLELQLNRIKSVDGFAEELSPDLIYLGLSRNFLNDESIEGLGHLPLMLNVLDLSDNDIYDLERTLEALAKLPSLTSLQLAGNPCSFCAAYAKLTIDRLPNLRWLDSREILETDRSTDPYEPHPNDLKSAFFFFNVFRIMSTPQPPKPEKGVVTSFCVELELPLLDSSRRFFLMYRHNESLVEVIKLPSGEDEEIISNPKVPSMASESKRDLEPSFHESDIYKQLKRKSSKIIQNYTTFKSNPIQWNKFMTFQNPVVKLFIPDLRALRNTFNSVITVRFVYNMTVNVKPGKDKKSDHSILMPGQQEVVLATIRCALKNPDWSQPSQHFHWDNTLQSEDAIHWGQGDLSVIQYSENKPTGKGKQETTNTYRQLIPEYLTCHFGFGIETIS